MFNHLVDFGFKRSVWQAVGFYFAYLLFVILLAVLASGIASVNYEDNFSLGRQIGTITGTIAIFGLGILVLKGKKRLTHFGYLCLVILSGIFAVFWGGLLGLIPIAFLTTRDAGN